jgi:hypothetical protein
MAVGIRVVSPKETVRCKCNPQKLRNENKFEPALMNSDSWKEVKFMKLKAETINIGYKYELNLTCWMTAQIGDFIVIEEHKNYAEADARQCTSHCQKCTGHIHINPTIVVKTF